MSAAAPGAVITVCPGVYTGTVVVAKPLTLRGAQHGVDARAGRTDQARESVIDGDGGAGIQIAGTTSGVTVDGFTIRNAGTATQVHDGIEAFSGGGGFTFVNNVITQTTYGINMNSAGPVASTVARSRFDSNNRSGDNGGSGVFICCGPGNNLSITDNLFTGNNSAAVNTAGDPARLSTGLKIQHNQSINDATFAVSRQREGRCRLRQRRHLHEQGDLHRGERVLHRRRHERRADHRQLGHRRRSHRGPRDEPVRGAQHRPRGVRQPDRQPHQRGAG